MKKLFFLLLVFLNFALLQDPAQAQFINYGYHEIFFEGITTVADGYIEFPIENSPLTYTPAVGDSISIHFGAYLWEDKWVDKDGDSHRFGMWGSEELQDGGIEIFQISASDGVENYVFDAQSANDWAGFDASIVDDFDAYLYQTFSEPFFSLDASISFNFNDSSGSFWIWADNCFTEYPNCQSINWKGVVTSAHIVAEPVPEPATLLLLGAGLVVMSKYRKRRR